MPSSAHSLLTPHLAAAVMFPDERLVLELLDGRTLTAPLIWFPRLKHATPVERAKWRLIGQGEGIHWPALDEDISVDALVAGRRSLESLASLERWLFARGAA